MLRSYKTEIKPTDEQKQLINKTLGVCRFIYNFYLSHNKEIYQSENRFVSGMEFSKWLNNEFIPNNPSFCWIKEVSSKAVKQSIMQAEQAFKRFFKGRSRFPKYKKKHRQNVKAYFPKNNATDLLVERHRIKVPTLGFVRLKEKGYLPVGSVARSCRISVKADRYYVSILVDDKRESFFEYCDQGLGVDLGIEKLAVVSNMDKVFPNINRTGRVKHLEKRLRREQRKLSRKYESLKKNKQIGGATRQNIHKQVITVQRIHQRLANIRENHINGLVSEIVKTKPSYITIEDLNVKGMMKNRHLANAIAQQGFYKIRTKLEWKCKILGIELRIVDRFYPSSKTCSSCGFIKKDLRLSDRDYICPKCGLNLDRDKNASINLANAKEYKIA